MKTRTAEQARNEFLETGITVSEWARRHGFSRELVNQVLSGKSKAVRGQAHRIAVTLGIKEGRVVSLENFIGGGKQAQTQE